MIKVHSYESMGTFDGPGLRLVVFLQGCNFRCLYCANPDTIDACGGTPTSPDEILRMAVDQKPFYGRRGGVTFSGGEPFCKAEPLYRLAVELKSRGKHLMAYSGYTFEELMQLSDPYVKKLLGELDLLVDGRFLMEEKNIDLRFRGSANQRVLDVPKSLEAGAAVWAEQYR